MNIDVVCSIDVSCGKPGVCSEHFIWSPRGLSVKGHQWVHFVVIVRRRMNADLVENLMIHYRLVCTQNGLTCKESGIRISEGKL